MSDTDDTDLLLLIPPEFYLVQSPDLSQVESDCDIDFRLEPNEIKDSIVSDLITQVNDLESRICMIEGIDRSVTLCSTCNEDSFANHSVNSLTESDILRSHIKSKSALSEDKLMLSFVDQSIISDTEPSLQEHFPKSQRELSYEKIKSEHTQPLIVYNTTIQNTGGLSNTEEQENLEVVEECNKPEVKLCKTSQEELLCEVDSFLGVKKKHKLTDLNIDKAFGTKEIEERHQDKENGPIETEELYNSKQKCLTALDCQQPEQSLALPEVYDLLKEMEETQYEMEKKLKLRNFQSSIETQDEVESNELRNRVINSGKMHTLKSLELEDLYARTSKSLFNNQIEKSAETNKNIQGIKYQATDNPHRPIANTSTQVSYIYKPSSSTLNDERRSYGKDSKFKSISPSRTSGNYNPIDVARANLPKNENKNIVSLEANKRSPRKFPGFRRQLNFERPDVPLRSSKSRSSLSMEQSKLNPNDIQEDDRVDLIQKTNRTSGSSQRLEEQFKAFALQRSTADNINPSINFDMENKHTSNEVPPKKISSNNLLSLSELWNKEPTFYSDDPSKLRQKLEEEKYRRQHCEQQIQVLQLRVLEEQEKLAVAVRVDQEKDRVIIQITESWRKLNDHWGELEEQRHRLAQQLQEERELAKVKSNELTKVVDMKIERWEKEVSQALDLAAGYKEKSEVVQSQMESFKRDTDGKLAEMRTELENLNEENKRICNENTSLLRQLEAFQEKLKEEEDLLSKLKNELEKSKKQILDQEAEISVIKEQKETVSLMLKEERNRSSMLEQQKVALQQAADEAVKREKAAKEEVRMSSERVEVARTELRAFYQGQLETVVKEKLQEFQNQLEAAETALKAELQLKEQQWIEKASEQCKQLKEKYRKDIQMVEESRKEEVNKWKMKLIESERLRSAVQSKLEDETNRRADIAQRLHTVMETQWREALNIISNPMQNMYEMPKEEDRGRWPCSQQGSERGKGGDMKPSLTNSTTSLAQAEDTPFFKEGVVTYRPSEPIQESHLKKYIQMLLERGPGNPIPHHDSLQDSFDQSFAPEDSPSHKWIMENTKKQPGQVERFGQSSKPPWK
ncbi:uncharacterized protein PF11_0207-like isoform X2 [Homalodisca vitripennis]|uniref:uncharacterized protein PF11_0207-like isoform X2 n=1 Tax=Homalodisca vitripennis TaxID=197043 RepID=UPI001EECE334|nr:uncharacterized protein PF11_0207-like isoform X2 [Homalodisca vitripennis]